MSNAAFVKGCLSIALLAAFSLTGRAEVTLVTGNDYPPFADQALPEGGLSTRLVRAAFAAVDEPTEVRFQPWLRGYRATLNGDFDATFPYVHTDERAEQMLFSVPFITVDTVIISRASHPLNYQTMESLRGAVLCRAQGWGLPAAIQQALDDGIIDVMDAPQYTSCFRMLLAGRVDFLLSNNLQWAVQAQVNELEPSLFYVAPKPIQRSNHYVIAPKTARGQAVIEQFNRGLALLRQTGEYEPLVHDYPLLRPEDADD
ncbi:substrate-binding periplasmic protein [Saccharospirillum mangrovi]|uniref:substrate-binding periplasmic protein n=1 Tax=Saccharospirillum mangrovi TaxID=2161747 RepID=UPI0013002BEA|nr:transporter substrate-binding domain-containing protein [Saccharospirillum mangrovi]